MSNLSVSILMTDQMKALLSLLSTECICVIALHIANDSGRDPGWIILSPKSSIKQYGWMNGGRELSRTNIYGYDRSVAMTNL